MDYEKSIEEFKQQRAETEETDITTVLSWLERKRNNSGVEVSLVSLNDLNGWHIDQEKGMVQHNDGADHFFTVEGVTIKKATGREVMAWDQPILNQAEGGLLVLLCQQREGTMKFLLHAKFEPGNIGLIQLAPTIQATGSNLKQHHKGKKPRFSEYWEHEQSTIIYKAAHNEEGGRFWQKSNINALLQLDDGVDLGLSDDDDYIWVTLSQAKKLMLQDNIVNPFVKTILSVL